MCTGVLTGGVEEDLGIFVLHFFVFSLALLGAAALTGRGGTRQPLVVGGADGCCQGADLGAAKVDWSVEGTLLDALDGVVAQAARLAQFGALTVVQLVGLLQQVAAIQVCRLLVLIMVLNHDIVCVNLLLVSGVVC